MIRHEFRDLNFEIIDLDQAVELILDKNFILEKAIHLVNAGTFYSCKQNKKLENILKGGFLLTDGRPLASFLAWKYCQHKQVRGPDLFRETLLRSPNEVRHFFIGSLNQNGSNLESTVNTIATNVSIAGYIDPPFLENFSNLIPEWVEMIKESRSDVVWIGLGTPKQDFVASEIAKMTRKKVIAVGAAFNYFLGNKKESPKFLRRIGLEWLFRLFVEPRRLFKRYLLGNCYFLRLLMIEAFK